jgi:hypothetical protein
VGMALRPIGDRVLIKPEKAPEQTDSGLWLSEHRKPENMGTVVAVGPCAHPLKHEASTLAVKLEASSTDFCSPPDELLLDRRRQHAARCDPPRTLRQGR